PDISSGQGRKGRPPRNRSRGEALRGERGSGYTEAGPKPMAKIESFSSLLPLLTATLTACGAGAATTGGAAPPSAKPADSATSAPGAAKGCPDATIDDAED